MNKKKMLGKIKWYKENKGYGYIIGGDNETYFFEISNCINKDEIFNEGDLVSFIPQIGIVDYAEEVERYKNE